MRNVQSPVRGILRPPAQRRHGLVRDAAFQARVQTLTEIGLHLVRNGQREALRATQATQPRSAADFVDSLYR